MKQCFPTTVIYATASIDYHDDGILAGEDYYRWYLRQGGIGKTYRSRTKPRNSQLTTDPYQIQAHTANEMLYDLRHSGVDSETLLATVQAVADILATLLAEVNESLAACKKKEGLNYNKLKQRKADVFRLQSDLQYQWPEADIEPIDIPQCIENIAQLQMEVL